MFSDAKTMLSTPGMLPVAFRHSERNVSLVTLRWSESSSSTFTAPRFDPLEVEETPGFPSKSMAPIEALTSVTSGLPPAPSLAAVSSSARSIRATASSVTDTGVPSGNMTRAWIRFESTFGNIVNGVIPLRIMPKATMSRASAPDSITQRLSIATSRNGA